MTDIRKGKRHRPSQHTITFPNSRAARRKQAKALEKLNTDKDEQRKENTDNL